MEKKIFKTSFSDDIGNRKKKVHIRCSWFGCANNPISFSHAKAANGSEIRENTNENKFCVGGNLRTFQANR